MVKAVVIQSDPKSFRRLIPDEIANWINDAYSRARMKLLESDRMIDCVDEKQVAYGL